MLHTCDKMNGILSNRLSTAELSYVGHASGMTEKWRLLCRHERDDKCPLLKRFSSEEQKGQLEYTLIEKDVGYCTTY